MIRPLTVVSVTALLTAGWVYTYRSTGGSAPNIAATPVSVTASCSMPVQAGLGTMEIVDATLRRGDVLHMRFSVPHAGYLAVKDPEGRFFYLVFPADEAVGDIRPLEDSKTFVYREELKINTRDLTGDPYEHGVYSNKPVFTRSGVYTFILGANLAVDSEDELVIRKVKYTHSLSKPKTKKKKPAGGKLDVALAN